MQPRNLLTKTNVRSIVRGTMDPKMIESVTNTLLRAMTEDNPFYFYVNNETVEAKINFMGHLCVTRVKGAVTLKFKVEQVSRNSAEHCAKRVIEVLS